nr:hypothetical protein Iba_chr10eCG14920 [Ipomoea batatas]
MPSMKAFPGCVINNLHATAGAFRLLLVVGRRVAARLTSSDFFVVHGRNADCKNKVMQPRFEYKCGFLNCDVALILQRFKAETQNINLQLTKLRKKSNISSVKNSVP